MTRLKQALRFALMTAFLLAAYGYVRLSYGEFGGPSSLVYVIPKWFEDWYWDHCRFGCFMAGWQYNVIRSTFIGVYGFFAGLIIWFVFRLIRFAVRR
jgi:hypothetical protein